VLALPAHPAPAYGGDRPMGEVAHKVAYGWSYGKSGVVICPRLRGTLEQAQRDAEEHYVRRDRERNPNSTPQRLEWREQTSPRGFGFANRFWSLFAERRPGAKRLGFTGDMFATGYILNEYWTEGIDD